jgi:hypothetical protein
LAVNGALAALMIRRALAIVEADSGQSGCESAPAFHRSPSRLLCASIRVGFSKRHST